MTLDELAQQTGEWLRGNGPMSDVVLSSRIRLARNVAGYPFLASASTDDRVQLYREVVDAVVRTSAGDEAEVFDLEGSDELDRSLLVERNLISQQHAQAHGSRGVTVTPQERRALMINEEDHLRMQVLRSGLELEDLWDEISSVDDTLAAELDFAFDEELGFLTACPTNLGTGMRVSVMVHLPALKLTQELERVVRAARDLQLAVRGFHGEGTDAIGDLYQISNQTTLGKSEREIIDMLGKEVIPQIVEYERAARGALIENRAHHLDDKIWRAYGVLANARMIGSEETQAMLSPLRMGIQMGRFCELGLKTLNEIFLFTQPAHLQRIHGSSLDGAERAVCRAEYVRNRLSQA
jgi:protein arginine kinase